VFLGYLSDKEKFRLARQFEPHIRYGRSGKRKCEVGGKPQTLDTEIVTP